MGSIVALMDRPPPRIDCMAVGPQQCACDGSWRSPGIDRAIGQATVVGAGVTTQGMAACDVGCAPARIAVVGSPMALVKGPPPWVDRVAIVPQQRACDRAGRSPPIAHGVVEVGAVPRCIGPCVASTVGGFAEGLAARSVGCTPRWLGAVSPLVALVDRAIPRIDVVAQGSEVVTRRGSVGREVLRGVIGRGVAGVHGCNLVGGRVGGA